MSLGCIIIYTIVFAVGPGPLLWIITTELFTQEIRPATTQLSCGANWTANFVIGILLPVVIVITRVLRKFMRHAGNML